VLAGVAMMSAPKTAPSETSPAFAAHGVGKALKGFMVEVSKASHKTVSPVVAMASRYILDAICQWPF
jgi:hypothetical protein